MDFPELINLFATHRVAEIETVPEYRDLCGRHSGKIPFQRQRHDTEVAKQAMEVRLDEQPTYAAQVHESFLMLQEQRLKDLQSPRSNGFDLYLALIVAGYKSNWSAAQQTYFDRVVPTIRTDNDFFLSFTSRGKEVGYKRINQRYWPYICSEIGAENYTLEDRRTRNLLAEAFYAKLIDAALKGFYYVRHENDNAIVVDKLRQGLEGSRVFVQLVENVMFDPDGGRTNYCEFEYRRAVEFIREEDRILFVVSEERPDDLEPSSRVPEPYRDWVEHIRRKAAPYLPPVKENDREKLEEIESKLRDVVALVKAARKNVLDRIPA